MKKWLVLALAAGTVLLMVGCGGTATHDATWHAGYGYALANKNRAASDTFLGVNGGGDPDENWCIVALPDDIPGTSAAASDWIDGCTAGLRATIGYPVHPGGRM